MLIKKIIKKNIGSTNDDQQLFEPKTEYKVAKKVELKSNRIIENDSIKDDFIDENQYEKQG